MNAFWALLVVSVTLRGCESTSLDPTIEYVSKNAAWLSIVASDGENWKAEGTVTITTPDPATGTTIFTTAFGTAAPTQSVGLFGLSAGTKYVVTAATTKTGTGADQATVPADTTFTVCTEADALDGLEVDSAGTTAEAFKIKWTAVTSATYRVYLDGTLVKNDLTETDNEFTFDATTLAGTGVSLNSEEAQMCKVEAAVAAADCTNDEIVQTALIECGVTGAAGSDTDCKSSAKMFYPVLTFVAVLFSMMAL